MIFEFTLFWGLFLSLIVIVLAAVGLWQLRDIKRRYDIAYDTAGIRILTTICWVLVALGAFTFFLFLMFGFYAAMRRYLAHCDNAILWQQQFSDVKPTAAPGSIVIPPPAPQPQACFARDLDVNGGGGPPIFTRIPCPSQTLV